MLRTPSGRVTAAITLTVLFLALMVSSTSAAITRTATSWWHPALGDQPWQWELGHSLSLTSASDMGTGVLLPNGKAAPAPVIYDIDGFDNSATTVADLHAKGFHAVCYIEVGAAENYRPDYKSFPAAALGKVMAGYPAERYLDIRNAEVVAVIEARLTMCHQKGFDAVETDIDESYGSPTGFPLTKAEEETYMTTLAGDMHALGMAWWIKNPDDTGDSYASDMSGVADAVLTEECNQYATCGLLSAYEGHKAVFNAEYSLATSRFCAADVARGFNGAKWNVNLNGGRHPCS